MYCAAVGNCGGPARRARELNGAGLLGNNGATVVEIEQAADSKAAEAGVFKIGNRVYAIVKTIGRALNRPAVGDRGRDSIAYGGTAQDDTRPVIPPNRAAIRQAANTPTAIPSVLPEIVPLPSAGPV